MLSAFWPFAAFSLATLAFPSPELDDPVHLRAPSDALLWFGKASLPKVLFAYTGGTIATGSVRGELDTTQYSGLRRSGEEILAQVPALLNVSQMAVKDFTVDGGETGANDTTALWMAKYINHALCGEDSDITAVVFTHGTNSLVETGFLLDATVNCGKPIVGVGSMRPWTALSFDGNANLYSAFTLAVDPDSRNRGAMIAFNDRIVPMFWADKVDANTPDAFRAIEQGNLGTFLNFRPFFYNTPSQPIQKKAWRIDGVKALPKVDVLYVAREFDGRLILDAMKNGAQGIVLLGTGAGSIGPAETAVAEVLKAGVKIVVGTRVVTGASVPSPFPTWAKGGYLGPNQVRITLQLAIAHSYSQEDIVALFENQMRATIQQPLTRLRSSQVQDTLLSLQMPS